jgi:signal peptidase
MHIKENLKKFWNFLKEDSWQSLIVSLIIAFIIIKFIFFPLLSFLSGTVLPLVIVESCSMYHSGSLEDVLDNDVYGQYNLTLEDAKKWPFKNGINKGDVIFAVGASNIKAGDVIIFNAGTANPIIHRIVQIDNTITTKGDNNPGLLGIEKNIQKEQVVGKALFRVPYIGWIKLIFFDWKKPASERGLCS